MKLYFRARTPYGGSDPSIQLSNEHLSLRAPTHPKNSSSLPATTPAPSWWVGPQIHPDEKGWNSMWGAAGTLLPHSSLLPIPRDSGGGCEIDLFYKRQFYTHTPRLPQADEAVSSALPSPPSPMLLWSRPHHLSPGSLQTFSLACSLPGHSSRCSIRTFLEYRSTNSLPSLKPSGGSPVPQGKP